MLIYMIGTFIQRPAHLSIHVCSMITEGAGHILLVYLSMQAYCPEALVGTFNCIVCIAELYCHIISILLYDNVRSSYLHYLY